MNTCTPPPKITYINGWRGSQLTEYTLATKVVDALVVLWAKLCGEDVGYYLYCGIPIYHIEGLP